MLWTSFSTKCLELSATISVSLIMVEHGTTCTSNDLSMMRLVARLSWITTREFLSDHIPVLRVPWNYDFMILPGLGRALWISWATRILLLDRRILILRNMNIHRWIVIHILIQQRYSYGVSHGSFMFGWVDFRWILEEKWGVMYQLPWQGVSLILIVAFVQLIDQTVTEFEVILLEHFMLDLFARIGPVPRNSGHLSFLFLYIFCPRIVLGRYRFIDCLFYLRGPKSLARWASESTWFMSFVKESVYFEIFQGIWISFKQRLTSPLDLLLVILHRTVEYRVILLAVQQLGSPVVCLQYVEFPNFLQFFLLFGIQYETSLEGSSVWFHNCTAVVSVSHSQLHEQFGNALANSWNASIWASCIWGGFVDHIYYY